MGHYDAASDAYQRMVDLRPGLASYNRVAFYRFVTGDAAGAIEVMRRAVRMGSREPENQAWCLADLGGMLFKTGASDEAGQAYHAALARFPGYHHALAGLARVAASQGRPEEAIQLLVQAQSKAPFPEYAGLLARLYRKTGREALAKKQIALLDMTDKLDRAAGETANRTLALALADLGHRTARAVELARAELEIRRDVYTYDALAWALFKDGKIEEAGMNIQRALGQNTPEPSFHEHAARIFEAAGRSDIARQHRESAVALNEKFAID
jgi:tetratricopeptide (TPR) repeat protein